MAKKQASGLYRTKVKVGVNAEGKDINQWISAKTKKELEEERQRVIAFFIDGTGLEADRLFGEYAVEWYHVRKEPFSEPSTRNNYRTILNKHLLPTFGNRNLRAIKPIELQAYLNTFAGKSATQITLITSALDNIFKSAVQDKILDRNPAEGLQKPAAKQPAEKRALTDDERGRVQELFGTHRYGLYLATMYYTGMRPGEVRGLKWKDFDWDSGLIHVQRDIDFAAKGAEGKLKTKAADRYIPISDELRSLLLQTRSMPEMYVFPGVNGKPLAASAANRIWLELMRDCDLVVPIERDKSGRRTEKAYYSEGDIRGQYKPLITPHAMRHNFITMCWEQGLDILITMKLVGHSDYQTTRNIYTHLSQKHLDQAKKDLELMFSKNKKSCTKVAQLSEN